MNCLFFAIILQNSKLERCEAMWFVSYSHVLTISSNIRLLISGPRYFIPIHGHVLEGSMIFSAHVFSSPTDFEKLKMFYILMFKGRKLGKYF